MGVSPAPASHSLQWGLSNGMPRTAGRVSWGLRILVSRGWSAPKDTLQPILEQTGQTTGGP